MKKTIIYVLTVVISLSIGTIGTLITYKYVVDVDNKEVSNTSYLEIKETETIKPAVNKIYDAVYLIETYNDTNKKIGSGTGFVYKKDSKYGYILTNHHVVDGSDQIIITSSNYEQIEANYLGSDEYSDVAILSIPAEKVSMVSEIGKSVNSEVGDTVFTVGSPLGSKYMGTVTKGILSGKDRQITVTVSNGNFLLDVIQTDAAINPGNSGGPLVNINGEVIGITSLKLVQDEIEGMGFALPIEYAMTYTERLEKGEDIERPIIGVQIAEITNNFILKSYKIKIDKDIKSGVVLLKVEENSDSEEAGLKAGDIITKINDNDITNTATFRYNLYKYSIGETIDITYIRDNIEKTTKLKLNQSLKN